MAVSQRTAKKRRGSVYKNEEICGTIMASLPVIRFVLFGLAPMVLALVMAFFKMKKITSFEGSEFVWFENFKYIFTDPNFGTSIVNTLIYVLVLPVSIFLGLLVAAVLNSKVRGKGFFRVVVFLPYICSTVAIVYIWKWLYNYNYGIFNVLLGRQIPWLIDKNMFRLSILMMLLWSTTGYKIIILAAGLTAVNSSYYEAAEIDGASGIQLVTRIVLPLARPSILVTAVMILIYVWNEYLFATTFMTGAENYTLAAGLYSLQATEMSGSWPIFAAASLVVSLPILIVFFAVQRHMTSGLTAGGVKG